MKKAETGYKYRYMLDEGRRRPTYWRKLYDLAVETGLPDDLVAYLIERMLDARITADRLAVAGKVREACMRALAEDRDEAVFHNEYHTAQALEEAVRLIRLLDLAAILEGDDD